MEKLTRTDPEGGPQRNSCSLSHISGWNYLRNIFFIPFFIISHNYFPQLFSNRNFLAGNFMPHWHVLGAWSGPPTWGGWTWGIAFGRFGSYIEMGYYVFFCLRFRIMSFAFAKLTDLAIPNGTKGKQVNFSTKR